MQCTAGDLLLFVCWFVPSFVCRMKRVHKNAVFSKLSSLLTTSRKFCMGFSKNPLLDPWDSNTHANVYRTVIMAESLWEVRLMNEGRCQAAADPQTKTNDLSCESACRLPESTPTVAIYYYYSAFYPPWDGKMSISFRVESNW